MAPGAALGLILQIVTVAGFGLTALRLYTSGLYLRYRFFFAYLIFSVFQTGTALAINPRSTRYLWHFRITEPILWFFYITVVLELYSLVLERHKGLYTVGRWLLYSSVALAVAISALALMYSAGDLKRRSPLIFYYVMIERGVACSMLIFLFLIFWVLSQYPVHLSRNVIVHSVVYTIFFLSNTLGLFLDSFFGVHISRMVSTMLIGLTAVCSVLWLTLLHEKGETRLVTLASLAPEQEEAVLTKLNALNSSLLRTARK